MAISIIVVALWAGIALAKEFHYGAAFGEPFNTTSDCKDVLNISPGLLVNWGLDNHDDQTLNICNNETIKFLPYLWGRPTDDAGLKALPNTTPPWAVVLENEPNWWGPEPLTADHGDGSNMTAAVAAARFPGHASTINGKWGVGTVKLISPSPVNDGYRNCTSEPEVGCAYQPQLEWLDQYFAGCNCLDDMWAINVHDYSCDLASSQKLAAQVTAHYPGKSIFFGEVGCGSGDATHMAQYLTDFAAWAFADPTVVGFVWAGINNVGTPGTELSLNGELQPCGQAFKAIQQKLPQGII